MNVIIGVTVLLIVVVGLILALAGEFGKGAAVAKSAITLVILSAICGYVTALASGSI